MQFLRRSFGSVLAAVGLAAVPTVSCPTATPSSRPTPYWPTGQGLPEYVHDADEWAWAKRLLFEGDGSGHFLAVVRDRVARGGDVALPEEFKKEVTRYMSRHGLARSCAQQRSIAYRVTEMVLEKPADPFLQLVYAATFGDVHTVDKLLNEGVNPVACFQDNCVLENAAAMGNVAVVRRLLRHPGVDPGMYSAEALGVPPVHAALVSIKQRQTYLGADSELGPLWEVVQALLEAAGGRQVMAGPADVIAFAPLPLLRAIAVAEPTFMAKHAAIMAAAIMQTGLNSDAGPCTYGEWLTRFDFLRCYLPPDHPMTLADPRSAM